MGCALLRLLRERGRGEREGGSESKGPAQPVPVYGNLSTVAIIIAPSGVHSAGSGANLQLGAVGKRNAPRNLLVRPRSKEKKKLQTEVK